MLALNCACILTLNAQTTSSQQARSVCLPPLVSDTSYCAPNTYTLQALSDNVVQWYGQATGGTVLHTGPSFSTSIHSSTTFYAEALCLDSSVVLPPHQSSFPSLTRGYWFTAPTDILITGLLIPTDGSMDDQSVEVIRFNSGPPNWPNVTNDFISLFYQTSVPGTSKINTNIVVSQGDVIGILGSRDGVNSYTASGPVNVPIAGLSVDLSRMGFQDNLASTQAYDVWTEPTQPIGRVQMFIGIAVDTSARVAMTVDILNSPDSVQVGTACFGDSVFAWGDYYTQDTVLFQIFTNSVGCDSILYFDVQVDDELDPGISYTIDQDALFIDSPVGNVNYQWIDCNGNLPIPGENSTFFFPTQNGSYALLVIGADSCTAMSPCFPFTSVGIDELSPLSQAIITPNPSDGLISINLGARYQNVVVQVFDALGRSVLNKRYQGYRDLLELQLPDETGVYTLSLSAESHTAIHRVIKN